MFPTRTGDVNDKMGSGGRNTKKRNVPSMQRGPEFTDHWTNGKVARLNSTYF